MSSILKALKKAEQNSSKKDLFPGLTTTPRRFYSPTNLEYSENIFHRYKRIWIFLGAVFIIGFSCFLFLRPDLKKQRQEALVFKSPVNIAQKETKQKKEKETASSLPVNAADMPPIHIKPESIPEPESSPQPVPKQKTVSINEKIPEVEQDISLTAKTADLPDIPKIETQAKAVGMPAEDLVSEPVSENVDEQSSADIPTTEDIAEIKDNDIKIQAISWSQIPEDRIAVINDKIVSEKDSIQEYRIVRINKDEIILSRSGKQYLLKFNYH